ARMWMQLGRYQQAVEPLTAIVDGGADEQGQPWLERLVEALILQDRFEEAALRLAAYTDEKSEGLIALLQRADVAAGVGDLDGALGLADEAVRGFPDQSVSFVKRAQLLLDRDERLVDAEADLATATELSPTDWRSWRILAAVQFRRGDTESALDALRRVVELNPTNNEVVLGLIVQLIAEGEDGEALSVALSVIDVRQRDISLMLSVARAFSERGLWKRAAAVMDRAWMLTRDPSIAVGYVDTLVNQTPADVDRADQVLGQVIDADEEAALDDTLLIARALVEKARDNPRRAASFIGQAFDAITPERYADASDLARQHLNWYTNLLRLYREDGPAEARRVAQEMYDARGANELAVPWLLFTLARIDFVIDDGATSEAARDSMLSIARDQSNLLVSRLAYRGLGASLYSEDDYQGAADVWTEALEIYPDDWEMLNNLAFTLASELGRPEDGLEIAEQAIRVAPERAQSYDTKARVLIELGRGEDAMEQLGQAEYRIQRSRTRLNVMMNRARAFILLGEASRAEQVLGQVRSSLQTLPDLRDDFESAIEEVDALIGGSPVGAAGG
ncbi:MAG: tetratricopeptide repeat protein, partial [Planctomycetota bacterium]